MRSIFARVPANLYNRIMKQAKARDLKLVAVVRQALELWLKEQGA